MELNHKNELHQKINEVSKKNLTKKVDVPEERKGYIRKMFLHMKEHTSVHTHLSEKELKMFYLN